MLIDEPNADLISRMALCTTPSALAAIDPLTSLSEEIPNRITEEMPIAVTS
jgi:hypothetical protein